MKEKILSFLKSKLNGVSELYLSGVAETFSKTIKDEKDIETVFSDGIIEALKFSATHLQIEGDRRATEAQKTALRNFQEKHGLNEDGTPIKREPKKKDTDPEEPAWLTAFKKEQADSIAALKAEIEQQKQEKALSVLAERVKSHEKLKHVPASYLKSRNLVPKSEAEIDQLVTEIETDYNGLKQELAEKGVIFSTPPAGGGSVGEKVTIDDYLDEKFPKEKSKVLTKK